MGTSFNWSRHDLLDRSLAKDTRQRNEVVSARPVSRYNGPDGWGPSAGDYEQYLRPAELVDWLGGAGPFGPLLLIVGMAGTVVIPPIPSLPPGPCGRVRLRPVLGDGLCGHRRRDRYDRLFSPGRGARTRGALEVIEDRGRVLSIVYGSSIEGANVLRPVDPVVLLRPCQLWSGVDQDLPEERCSGHAPW